MMLNEELISSILAEVMKKLQSGFSVWHTCEVNNSLSVDLCHFSSCSNFLVSNQAAEQWCQYVV